jgi:hypothetical protein
MAWAPAALECRASAACVERKNWPYGNLKNVVQPARPQVPHHGSACLPRRRHRSTRAEVSARASGAVTRDYRRLRPLPGRAAKPRASEFEFPIRTDRFFGDRYNSSNAGVMTGSRSEKGIVGRSCEPHQPCGGQRFVILHLANSRTQDLWMEVSVALCAARATQSGGTLAFRDAVRLVCAHGLARATCSWIPRGRKPYRRH